MATKDTSKGICFIIILRAKKGFASNYDIMDEQHGVISMIFFFFVCHETIVNLLLCLHPLLFLKKTTNQTSVVIEK